MTEERNRHGVVIPTAAHLKRACEMAIQARGSPIDTTSGPRIYVQSSVDSGSVCCVHGFAVILANPGINVSWEHYPNPSHSYRELDAATLGIVDFLINRVYDYGTPERILECLQDFDTKQRRTDDDAGFGA